MKSIFFTMRLIILNFGLLRIQTELPGESFELKDSWDLGEGSQQFPENEKSGGDGEETEDEVSIQMEVQEELEKDHRNLNFFLNITKNNEIR